MHATVAVAMDKKESLLNNILFPVLFLRTSLATRYDKGPSIIKRKPPWAIEINKAKSLKNQSNPRSRNHKSYELAGWAHLMAAHKFYPA